MEDKRPAASPASPSGVVAWVMAHRKALVAYLGTAVTLLVFAFPHATWLPVVISLATALGVHATPNAKP